MSPLNADVLLSAALGAIGVKVLDYIFSRLGRRSEEQQSARALLGKHLDPILKATDELVGKLRSLAETDFADFRRQPEPAQAQVRAIRRLAALHLVVQLWARIQLLRIESASVALGSRRAGAQLLNFLYELESQHVRVLDRSWQRATGEASVKVDGAVARPLTLEEFVRKFETDAGYQRWIEPLAKVFDNTNKAENRQRLLVYGVVLHALIDTLDDKHVVTRRRRPWPHKLAQRSRDELERRVFRLHLDFVKKPQHYTRPK